MRWKKQLRMWNMLEMSVEIALIIVKDGLYVVEDMDHAFAQ